MFTTSAQMLQLNQCYLEVHGIKNVPEVRTELMQLHRRGNFFNNASVFQHQIYNIGSSLSTADTQFQTTLTLLQGELSIMLWIRPSSQGGSTDYGLGPLEENLGLSQVNYITDDSGLAIFQSLPERFCRRFFIADHFPGSFRSNVVHLLPFSLQPGLSATDGSDIGHLTLNNNNLTLTSGAAGSNGPYSLVVFVKTAAFLTEDSMGNVTLSYQ